MEKVKGSQVILDLLRLVAFQIGQEVSTSELGRKLGLDHKTIIRYLDLLEKSFVLLQLRGFNRNDIGMLWEIFLVAERLKKQQYKKTGANNYFWRTYDQKEIDWVEEASGQINAYEFKWRKKLVNVPPSFKSAYPKSSFKVINRENYFSFVS